MFQGFNDMKQGLHATNTDILQFIGFVKAESICFLFNSFYLDLISKKVAYPFRQKLKIRGIWSFFQNYIKIKSCTGGFKATFFLNAQKVCIEFGQWFDKKILMGGILLENFEFMTSVFIKPWVQPLYKVKRCSLISLPNMLTTEFLLMHSVTTVICTFCMQLYFILQFLKVSEHPVEFIICLVCVCLCERDRQTESGKYLFWHLQSV